MIKFHYSIIRDGTIIVDNIMCYSNSEKELYNELEEFYPNDLIYIN